MDIDTERERMGEGLKVYSNFFVYLKRDQLLLQQKQKSRRMNRKFIFGAISFFFQPKTYGNW